MTQSSAREARIHLVSEAVIASYIQDISAGSRGPEDDRAGEHATRLEAQPVSLAAR